MGQEAVGMADAKDCVFCKIVSGKLPAAKVLETQESLAILDIGPVAPGHVLLMPKSHYESLGECPPESLAKLASELPRLAQAIKTAMRVPALNIILNDGSEAGQEVPHIHIHLVPRTKDDEFHIKWPRGSYEKNQMEEIRTRIAAALGS